MTELRETRRRSAALFGNEKTVEVLIALDEEGTATAQMISVRTGIAHTLVRDALVRLLAGGAIQQVPRIGGPRSPLYYEPVIDSLWTALASAARVVAGVSAPSARSTESDA